MVAANAQTFLKTLKMHPSDYDLEDLTTGFLSAMQRGLQRRGGIPMLDTNLTIPKQPISVGDAALIDAGGTWLRTALFIDGVIQEEYSVPIPQEIPWRDWICLVAEQVLPFARRAGRIGFCFSYPVSDEKVIRFSKEIAIQGAEGHYPAAELTAALVHLGCVPECVKVVNDAAAVLLGGILQQPVHCGGAVSLLCGSGMNSACILHRADGSAYIVNCESGAYTNLKQGLLDRYLDQMSMEQGMAIAEKMTAGRYLPELWHRLLCAAGASGLLTKSTTDRLWNIPRFTGTELDAFYQAPQGENRPAYQMTNQYDICFARELAGCLLQRAAKILCANVTAMLQLTGQGTYQKYPAVIIRQGAMLEQNSLLPQMLNRFLQTFTKECCGIYTISTAVKQVVWKGTAAAVWIEQAV